MAIATLLAAPVINPIVIASTLAAFGPGLIFWGRLGLTLVIATLIGLIFSLQANPGLVLRGPLLSSAPGDTFAPEAGNPPAPVRPRGKLRQVFLIAADEFFEMGRFLVLGALLAALMQTFVGRSALLAVGQEPVLSVLALVVLAVLLSVCSTVDAFIALAFTGTFMPGAVLAFLVFGPMVDIKSTLMFLRVFQPRPVIYLVLLPLLMTLVFTVFLNYFGKGW
jgi:uncharacterized membrane protein YraQ (UPF0718 family)